MTLRNLILLRIKEHRERGDEERVRKLEDALRHIDRVSPCNPRQAASKGEELQGHAARCSGDGAGLASC